MGCKTSGAVMTFDALRAVTSRGPGQCPDARLPSYMC